jgi:two-component system chemotaxis sensor kinase CheA
VIEELADPLTHMIRNSLDHGLEPPEDRLEAGKPEEGQITLSDEHRGGRIEIQIADDGRGINRPKVLALAQEKGIVAEDATLTDEEIDNLIFAPGFSTAEEVTDLSGRGVGMDVVRRNIQSLGGRVSVQSEPGKGARIQLTLPLTLAVLDGMVVGVGEQRYVVPIGSIIETVRPRREDVNGLVGGGQVVNIRGDYVRLVPLSRIFGIPDAQEDPSKALVVFVEADGGRTVGLVVDMLAGQQQVVIKSLESNFRAVDGIASATILGDGSVCLILDIDELADMEGVQPGHRGEAALAAPAG